MIPSPLMSMGYRDRNRELSLETPVVRDSTELLSSLFRSSSTSVMALALSATPVTNRAGSPERRVPTVTLPCWLSSAMVMDTRMVDPRARVPFFQT